MKILVWHGYLLTGSGSNVYTSNIARSWRARGHDVLVLCQEKHPEALGFVDEEGTVDASRLELHGIAGARPASGWCGLARPDIGRLLPVYVYDDYEGFEVKVFPDLSDRELQNYVRANVGAMVTAIRSFEPDIIITGHEVMGPFIAKEACEPTGSRFIAKLHGSALEYAVKKQERYRDFARRGLGAAIRVAGGSRYMLREAAAHIPGWADKGVVVNPGCDIDLFRPVTKQSGSATVGYVGKFIASKGVHHLLAALPLAASARKAVIVGYGGADDDLRGLATALSSGDIPGARRAGTRLGMPDALWEGLPAGYQAAARAKEIEFTGRLEHGPLSKVLPTFDVLAVPSIVPEAFGMVAAEAAAAGVLPVVPGHSGIAEAGAAIEEAIGRPGFLTYDPHDPVRGLAAALERVLSMDAGERAEAERAAVELARARWSWDGVADALASLAVG